MSVENNIFLRRDKMPTPGAWVAAIRAHGFELDMDADFDVVEFEGFLPCTYKGKEAGFEYWAEETNPDELQEEGLLSDEERAQLGDCDFLITLETSSSFRDLTTSVIAAAVLTELSDGFLAEGGAPPFLLADNSVAWAKGLLPKLEEQFD